MADKRISISVDSSGARRGIDDIMSSFDKLNKSVGSTMGRIRNQVVDGFKAMWNAAKRYTGLIISGIKKIGNALVSVKTLFSAVAFAAFLRSTVKATVLFEKFASTLTVVTGDFTEAQKQVKNLINISNQLGISFEDALSPFAKFFAAARGSLGNNEIIQVFTAFGKAAVALQLNGQEIQGVFLALQQIASKGRVSMEELRLQLAERIPGAMQLAADAMGTTIRKLEDDIRKGSVASGEFLIKFANKIEEEYSRAAAVASQTTIAFINRFKNAWLTFLNEIGTGGLTEGFKTSLKLITDWMNDSGALANRLGDIFGTVIVKATEMATSFSGDDILSALETMVNWFNRLKQVISDIANSNYFEFFFPNEELEKLNDQLEDLESKQGRLNMKATFMSTTGYGDFNAVLKELQEVSIQILETKDAIRDLQKPFTFEGAGLISTEPSGDPRISSFIGPREQEGPTLAQLKTFNQARQDANLSIEKLNLTKDLEGILANINQELADNVALLNTQVSLMNDENQIMSTRISAAQRISGLTETITKLRTKQETTTKKIAAEELRALNAKQKSANLLADIDRALKSQEARERNIFFRVRDTTKEVSIMADELRQMRDDADKPLISDQQQNDIRQKLKDYKAAVTDMKDAQSDLMRFTDSLGNSFSSAFEEAILSGEKLSDVLQGLAEDIARLVMRQTISAPIANFISGALSGAISSGFSFSSTPQSSAPLVAPSGGTGSSAFTTSQTNYASALGTPFAAGGVSPGAIHKVGENGVEYVSLPPGARVTPGKDIGPNIMVNVENSGVETEVDTETRPDGTVLVNLINTTVANSINTGGTVARALGQSFGNKQVGVVR